LQRTGDPPSDLFRSEIAGLRYAAGDLRCACAERRASRDSVCGRAGVEPGSRR